MPLPLFKKILFKKTFLNWKRTQTYSEQLSWQWFLETDFNFWQRLITYSSSWRLRFTQPFSIPNATDYEHVKNADHLLIGEMFSLKVFQREYHLEKCHKKPHSISIRVRMSIAITVDQKCFQRQLDLSGLPGCIMIDSKQGEILKIFLWRTNSKRFSGPL